MSVIDFTDKDYLRSPQQVLFELSQKGPILPVKIPKIGKAVLISGNDALIDLLKSPHRFTTDSKTVGKDAIFASAGIIPEFNPGNGSLFLKDGKDHRDIRQHLDQALRKSGLKSLRPNIALLADQLLETHTPAKRLAANQRDLVLQFAMPLPAMVMIELLGIPKDVAPNILKWAIQISFPSGILGNRHAQSARKHLYDYLKEFFSTPSLLPPESLGAKLLENKPAASADQNANIVDIAFFLILAGHATTSSLISLGCLTLLDHPAQLELLKQDWTRVPDVVEEILRFASPAQTTAPRYAKDTFDFHGHTFKRGDIAFGFLAASNMDPASNKNPLEFDITRDQNRQISFGAGAHFCGGAQLAHIIAEIALQRLFSKWPEMRLSSEAAGSLAWSKKFGVRNLNKMIVETQQSTSRF
ncbi:cytochrome P450 [Hirschia baltica]|uniref:Cytochrome P450 n=1 Tax=Hirschia baltica (strain ATCC 49814 / DSM 5838 / IFAM 1418) TaxID=582402 RepID=C6XKZ2_HIRBI|nr:cytochrome P450 [Hirschia baltica]ACT57821.1 cytochrome P450 [Hirschia baltica ATCC 49814]